MGKPEDDKKLAAWSERAGHLARSLSLPNTDTGQPIPRYEQMEEWFAGTQWSIAEKFRRR